jgi:magnesium chelatase family protein
MAVVVMAGALHGVDAVPIRVEVDLLRRLPVVSIVGLAASAVKESGERIRSAIEALGTPFPRKRIVVNLAPADLRKDGTALDLPIALGILAAAEEVPRASVDNVLAVGELALGGELRAVRGALSLALLAREQGRTLILPRACAAEAALVPGAEVVGADHLGEVVGWLRGERSLGVEPPPAQRVVASNVDLAEVRGQELARLALEVAAAGAHHLMLIGPPGCGKSMLARRLPTILPPLELQEALDTSRVASAAGLSGFVTERPFRAPHHSVTVAGLVGDQHLRPGEVSLAHHGVLFLDEAPEFSRAALEVLRQPLEDGVVRLTRARGAITYPASITLVLACNPCPCGLRGSKRCHCTDGDVQRYLRRLSGPLMDRIDLFVELGAVPAHELMAGPIGEPSATVRRRVEDVRARQRDRGQSVVNARLEGEELERVAAMTRDARQALFEGVRERELSGRGATRTLRVARTIADREGKERIDAGDVALAFSFRPPAALV